MRCVACGQPVPDGMDLCATCTTDRIPAATLAQLARNRLGDAPVELRPRFVGREAQLRALRAAWDRAQEGEGGCCAVVGEPGAGKTRLVRELCRRADHYASATAGGALPYAGFVRLLRARLGISPGEDRDAARAKIAAGVAERLPGKADVADLIANLCQVSEPLSDQHVEARTFIALRRFFAADAARGPLLLFLDDLDQAGAESVNLLHYLAAGLASSLVLLVCAGRPSLYDAHPAFGDGEAALVRIDLGPLPPDEAEALFGEILGDIDVPARLPEVHAVTLFDESKNDAPKAEDYFRRGVDIFRQLGNQSELARGLERFGRHKLERGEIAAGRGLLEEAEALFSRLSVAAEVGKVIRELEGGR